LEDGPVLAEALRQIGKHPKLPAGPLLESKLGSARPEVRAVAIEALGELRAVEGRERLVSLLADQDSQVRRAAARAAGNLKERRAIEPLLNLTTDADPSVRAASLDSLRLLEEPRGVPLAVAALDDRQTQPSGLRLLHALGGPQQATAVVNLAKRNPSFEVLTSAVQALNAWRDRSGTTASEQQALDRAVADIQGASGSLLRWQVNDPTVESAVVEALGEKPLDGRTTLAAGAEGRVAIAANGAERGAWYWARTDIAVADPAEVEFLGSSNGGLRIWLNGRSIYHRKNSQGFRVDSDRATAALAKGDNRLVVAVEAASSDSPVEFHLRFRRKSAVARHERLAGAALAGLGNPDRGRAVLLNLEKSLCLKCHRVDDQGERTGPELTGLGSRFSPVTIAESILEPSRAIAPSFDTLVVRLQDGRVLSGVKVAQSEATLTLADNQGQKHVVATADIESQKTSSASTMPEGLEKAMTDEEFVDLVAYLASLKENPN
jgi:putative heme-binding domain-containing protein